MDAPEKKTRKTIKQMALYIKNNIVHSVPPHDSSQKSPLIIYSMTLATSVFYLVKQDG